MPNPFSPSQLSKSAYTRLEAHARRVVQEAADELAKTGDRSLCFRRVAGVLDTGTGQAFRYGKQVGLGVFAKSGAMPLYAGERARVQELTTGQTARLRAWLLSGEPLQAPGQPAARVRLDMYALSLHGAYQEGLAFGLLQAGSQHKGIALAQDDAVWLWVTKPGLPLAVCRDCLERAQKSRGTPYTLGELLLIGFPATGCTRCLTRCRCHVELSPVAGNEILQARAHRRTASTAFYGVVDPLTRQAVHGNTVGKGTK